MTGTQFKDQLHKLSFNCCQNIRYYQAETQRYGWWDKAIRVTVLVVALICLVLAIPPFAEHAEVAWAGFVVSSIALIMAAILNVIPVGDWEKTHGELFRLWNELQRDVVIEELKAHDLGDEKDASAARLARLAELKSKQESLHAIDNHQNQPLWKQCYACEMKARFGVETAEEVEVLRAQRAGVFSPSAAEDLPEAAATG